MPDCTRLGESFGVLLALALAFTTPPAQTTITDDSRVTTVGGIKSANTPTGPVVNGLALSLTNRQFNIRNRDRYTWLALELRNESTRLRWIFGFNKLAHIRALVTDGSGHSIASYKYPKIDFDAPVSSNGFPLPGGKSVWLAVPIDALVPIEKPGTYVVRVKTAAASDTRTNQPIELISNPLTIHV